MARMKRTPSPEDAAALRSVETGHPIVVVTTWEDGRRHVAVETTDLDYRPALDPYHGPRKPKVYARVHSTGRRSLHRPDKWRRIR